MNKLGKMGAGTLLMALMVLGIFSIGGGLLWFGFKAQQTTLGGTTTTTVASPTGSTESVSFCANNPDVDLEVRARDASATTATYRAGSVYLVDKSTGNGDLVTNKSIATTTSTRSDLTDSLKCAHKYDVWSRTDQDSGYIGFSQPVVLESTKTVEDPVQLDLSVLRSTGMIKIRCYDNLLKDQMHDENIVGTGANTTTNYLVIDTTGYPSVNFTSTTNSATNMALSNNEDFDVTCDLKTNETDYQFGLNTIVALDYSDSTDTADWQEDMFAVYVGGTKLSEFNVVNNDRIALTGYEKFWKIPGGITEDRQEVRFVGKTATTGTVDRDLILRLVATGDYLSNDNDNVVLHDVGFRDDGSTRTEIATARARTFRFNVD